MRTFGPHLRHVRGVEPDPRAVRVARERGLDVMEGTAEQLPAEVQDRRYDLIVFSHVLEHTLDPVLALANARELLTEVPVIGRLTGDATVESGDCLWIDAQTLAIGRGVRSNQAGIEARRDRMKRLS